jgi:hypothetical protein
MALREFLSGKFVGESALDELISFFQERKARASSVAILRGDDQYIVCVTGWHEESLPLPTTSAPANFSLVTYHSTIRGFGEEAGAEARIWQGRVREALRAAEFALVRNPYNEPHLSLWSGR